MHILVVSQYFWPENFRINDLCAELVSRGHKVTVLTGKPNYPDGEIFERYLSHPNEFDSYCGCDVVRVPMVARGKGSSVKLMFNYLTFALFATIIGAWKLRGKSFDVIFVFEPSPVTVGLPAIFLKKLKKTPVVFWVLDLWPETLEAVGVLRSPRGLSLVGKLVSFIYNRCDLVLGQSKAFYSGISRYCNDASKIKYFPSWSESIFTTSVDSSNVVIDEFKGFKVVFAGNVGDAQDFPAVLKAIEIVQKKGVKFKLFIVGDGRVFDWLKAEVEKKQLEESVVLLGRHPLELMPSFYYSADALLASLKDNPVFAMTIPGKIQTYMASGKPILTMLTGEGSRVVEEAGCGYVAESGNAELLAQNIIKMSGLKDDALKLFGENAQNYASKEFDRDKLITQLEGWFTELISKKKGLKK
ncbi:MAG: glycosyltransferase family 4 protein [Thiomicrorhabdus sp.]|nr:glycosyltransferase family 4 protein [Thiomicrorhabdus sp.]